MYTGSWSGTELLKTLEFPDESNKCAFCYANKMTFGLHLMVEAGCQEKKPCNWRIGTSSPTSLDSREERGAGS